MGYIEETQSRSEGFEILSEALEFFRALEKPDVVQQIHNSVFCCFRNLSENYLHLESNVTPIYKQLLKLDYHTPLLPCTRILISTFCIHWC